MMYWTNKSYDESNNIFNNMFYIHIWNEKDQNLIFFIPLVSKICAHSTLLFLLWGEGWWNGDHIDKLFPFSCLPVDILKLKLGELFDNIFVVFFILLPTLTT
jgi:hypothetical protein